MYMFIPGSCKPYLHTPNRLRKPSFIPLKHLVLFPSIKQLTFALAFVRSGFAGRRCWVRFRLRGDLHAAEKLLSATGGGHGVRSRSIGTDGTLGSFADCGLFASFAAFTTVVGTFTQGQPTFRIGFRVWIEFLRQTNLALTFLFQFSCIGTRGTRDQLTGFAPENRECSSLPLEGSSFSHFSMVFSGLIDRLPKLDSNRSASMPSANCLIEGSF